MKMEITRRIFLAVLGAGTAASAAKWKRPVSAVATTLPGGICFYTGTRGQPARTRPRCRVQPGSRGGRPRTSAITYLPADIEP